MKAIKVESGEFCVLIKSKSEYVIELIKNDFFYFRSAKKADFTIYLKVCNPSEYKKNKFGKLDPNGNSCEIPIKRYNKGRLLLDLRVIFSFICSKNNSVLLHAAAVADKNRAYVFCGPPGSGKSTISGLIAKYKLLSDEYLIIKKTNNKFNVFGTSLGGEYFKFGKILKPNNRSAIVDKIFFIKQANEHRVEKKRPSDTMQELLNEVFFCRDKSRESQELIAGNFNLIYNLCTSIDCYDLYFAKNDGFWKEITKLKNDETIQKK